MNKKSCLPCQLVAHTEELKLTGWTLKKETKRKKKKC